MHILQSKWSVIRCDPDSATPVLLRPRNGFKGILPQIWRVQPRTPEVEAERLHEALVTLINHWILGTPFPDLKAIFHHGTTVLPKTSGFNSFVVRFKEECDSMHQKNMVSLSLRHITPSHSSTKPTVEIDAGHADRSKQEGNGSLHCHGVNGAEQPDSIWPLPRYQMRSAKVVRCTRCSDIWRSVGSVVPLLRLVPVNWQSLIATKQRQKAWPCLGYNYITWYHIYPLISPQNNKKYPSHDVMSQPHHVFDMSLIFTWYLKDLPASSYESSFWFAWLWLFQPQSNGTISGTISAASSQALGEGSRATWINMDIFSWGLIWF